MTLLKGETSMSDVDQAPTLAQRLTAEALGTFLLVFLGCGSFLFAATSGENFGVGLLSIALAFGGALTLGILAFGRISGAHFNPAVSVGVSLAGRQSWKDTGLYAATQVVAGIVAALALFVLLQGFDGFEAEGRMGQTAFGDEGTGYAVWSSFLLELILTLIFVFVILAVTDSRSPHPAAAAAATIGLTLVVIHLVGIGATGASVNPARSIGPALFAGGDHILQLWLYILAPLIGGAVAGFLYPLVLGRDAEAVPGSGLNFSRPEKPAFAGGWDAQQQQWQGQQQWDQSQAQPGQMQPGQTQTGQTQTGQWQGGQWDTGQQQWDQGQAQQAQPQIQTEYPGWKWDAQAQQWVADPSTAPGAQQWQQGQGEGTGEESPRTQIRDTE